MAQHKRTSKSNYWFTTGVAALALATSLTAQAATPTDSLSVPMFGDRSESLWPLQIGLEIVDAGGHVVVPLRELVVADGQHTTFTEAIATPRGSHAFELELVARHHAGNKIELEFELLVRQARFESLTWSDYLLHRLSLGPRPGLGPQAIAAARADIVETRAHRDEPAHTQSIMVDGARYEIRLYAASLRG